MSRKFALIIGNSKYKDTSLARLKTPDADVRALAAALRDPALGGFDEVQEIINQPESAVSRAISTFFTDKKPDDLLLLYFSGHGVLDPQGRLFLAVKDTQRSLLNATAIPAAFITDDMDSCRSRRQILILDCCHSGAFAKGSKGDAPAVTKSTFEGNGYGRVVLTASDSTQYALEGDQVIQQAALSLFTHYLLEGLTTGAADSRQDGWITLDEWYDYAYERVIGETPDQTPRKWVYNQQGELVVARSPRPSQPQELPQELQAALHSQFAGIRLGAVQELSQLLHGSNPALAELARAALQELAEKDDSRRVSADAAQALAKAGTSVMQPGVSIPSVTGAPAAGTQEESKTGREPLETEKTGAESESTAKVKADRPVAIGRKPAPPKQRVEVDQHAAEPKPQLELQNATAQPPLQQKLARPAQGIPELSRRLGPRAVWAGLGVIAIIALAFAVPSLFRRLIAGPTPTPPSVLTLVPATSPVPVLLVQATETRGPTAQASPTTMPTVQPSLTPEPTPLPLQITDARGVPMVLVPAGVFQMGANADEGLAICQDFRNNCQRDQFVDEEPIHTVTLDSFYIDTYEVTNARYAECVQASACLQPSDISSNSRSHYYDNPEFSNFPVIYVSWQDAQTYCAWREARLPTEAEWEKAARGDDDRLYPGGDSLEDNQANVCDQNCPQSWAIRSMDDGYADTSPVGSYPDGQSPYGLMDMAGNVWEWVSDWYEASYYAGSPQSNPSGPQSGEDRVIRGGSWYDGDLSFLRVASRVNNNPSDHSIAVGFRCAVGLSK